MNTQRAQLGDIQETLFIPLAARARETTRKHPVLRDPKAVDMVASIDFDTQKYARGYGGLATLVRTVILDYWVRRFMAAHPDGTVVELGTGLNTRFDRVDNGSIQWFDLDLPDTIELRRRFFEDTGRRRMISASVLDDDWIAQVSSSPGPYFFVTEGVLVYLPEDDVRRALTRVATRFPGALIALDTYSTRASQWQHKMAAKRGIKALWEWPCDDPRGLERTGLRLLTSVPVTRPPRAVRARLPIRCRCLLAVLDPLFRNNLTLTLFKAR